MRCSYMILRNAQKDALNLLKRARILSSSQGIKNDETGEKWVLAPEMSTSSRSAREDKKWWLKLDKGIDRIFAIREILEIVGSDRFNWGNFRRD